MPNRVLQPFSSAPYDTSTWKMEEVCVREVSRERVYSVNGGNHSPIKSAGSLSIEAAEGATVGNRSQML